MFYSLLYIKNSLISIHIEKFVYFAKVVKDISHTFIRLWYWIFTKNKIRHKIKVDAKMRPSVTKEKTDAK